MWVRDPDEHPLAFITAYKEAKSITNLENDAEIIKSLEKNRKEAIEGMLNNLMVADE